MDLCGRERTWRVEKKFLGLNKSPASHWTQTTTHQEVIGADSASLASPRGRPLNGAYKFESAFKNILRDIRWMEKVSKRRGNLYFEGGECNQHFGLEFRTLGEMPTGSHDPLTTISLNTINMLWEYQLAECLLVMDAN